MKKTLLLLLLTITTTTHAQWIQQNSGVTSKLNDVYCITEDIVVVVGDFGTILKTTDGGANWVTKTSGTTQNLLDIKFINATTGYTVGFQGTLLKTTDAGENWTPIAIGETTDLYGLSALSESIFYISGTDGVLKKTIDGGASFVAQPTGTTQPVRDIQYLNESVGFAQEGEIEGNQLFRTIDGGATWTFIDYINSFYFLNENVGFINSFNGLSKTIDGGSNFTLLGSTFSQQASIFSLSENNVWMVDYALTLCGCNSSCITKGTLNDADEYESVSNCNIDGITDFTTPFESIHFASETKGYIVGWGGKIYKNSTGIMLGTDDVSKRDAVSIYPNPVSDKLNIAIEGSAVPFLVELTNTLGEKLPAKSFDAGMAAAIDVTSLSKGVYFVTVTGGGKSVVRKVIVN
jgi:photosystem II stability/assembly factor-like uncharacterized protein